MTETAFDPEELATARAEVSRALGSQLAEKASDSFCVATYRQRTRPAVSPRQSHVMPLQSREMPLQSREFRVPARATGVYP